MITCEVRDNIVLHLQNRIDTLRQEYHVGCTSFHFCHPMQRTYRQEKEKEIADINALLETLNQLEFE